MLAQPVSNSAYNPAGLALHNHKVRLKIFLTIITCLVGILLTVYCYYPGYMSSDSIFQLMQGRSGNFDDWHPPLMSLMWGVTDRVIPGPAGMLIFHNLLFWCGLSLLIVELFGHMPISWFLILVIGFWPPVFALLGTIWKDVGLGVSLVFTSAMYFRAQQRAQHNQSSSNAYNVAGSITCFYALSVRHNAVAPVLPLLLWACWIFLEANSCLLRRKTKIVFSLLLCTIMYIIMQSAIGRIDLSLTNHNQKHPGQIILIHDLVGISIDLNQDLLPDYFSDGGSLLTPAELKKIYSPITVDPLFFGDSNIRRLRFHNSANQFDLLTRRWEQTIPQHLHLYLEHRWTMFKAISGIGMKEVWYPFHTGIDPNPWGLKVRGGVLNRGVMVCLNMLKNSIFFRVWLYGLTIPGVMLLAVSIRKNHRAGVYAVGCSGAFNLLHYFFVGDAPDFRYSWWTVCALLLISAITLANSFHKSYRNTLPPIQSEA